jgi:hypothetical protein
MTVSFDPPQLIGVIVPDSSLLPAFFACFYPQCSCQEHGIAVPRSDICPMPTRTQERPPLDL